VVVAVAALAFRRSCVCFRPRHDVFGELTVVQPLNDEAMHFEMVRWAVQQIHEGNALPLDGWFPYLSLGDAQFSHYQSLPHLITAYASLVFGSDATPRWAG
jgi:hypothetical protein